MEPPSFEVLKYLVRVAQAMPTLSSLPDEDARQVAGITKVTVLLKTHWKSLIYG